MGFWIYILQCSDGLYYTGHTDDLEYRMEQHKIGEVGFTASRKPLKLVFSEEFPTRDEAKTAEHQVKKWSRAKKEALIKGNWELIRILAKKKFNNKHSACLE